MPTISECACCEICRISVLRYASGIQSLGSIFTSASIRSWNARSSGLISSSVRSFLAPVSTICAYIQGLLKPPGLAAPLQKRYTFFMVTANSVSRSTARRGAARPGPDPRVARWIRTELRTAPPKAIAKRAGNDLRKELGWEGFGALGPWLFVRPAGTADTAALTDTLRALHTERRIVVLTAHDVAGAQPLAAFAEDCWNLQNVAAEYRRFIARFGRVIRAFDDGAGHDPQQCFVVRTLLIHEFRRVSLHDPQLPAALLPADWPGPAAYVLCRNFYRRTHRCAEQHLAATLETGPRALPPAGPSLYERFGGL